MTAEEVAQKIAALNQERAERLASAEAHEHQAREDRRRATAAKKESAEWTAALQSLRVKQLIETDQQAAAKAKAEAEADRAKAAAVLAEVEKMKADLAAGEKKPE